MRSPCPVRQASRVPAAGAARPGPGPVRNLRYPVSIHDQVGMDAAPAEELLGPPRGRMVRPPGYDAAMRREIFTDEHEAFRDLARAFIAKELTPHWAQWEKDQMVSRDAWLAAGRAGLLGIAMDEKYGGGGNSDYRFYAIFDEELARAGACDPGFAVHNDMIGPYLDRLCTPEQKERWLPGYCSGEKIAAIAMTEPGAGSDLQGIRTTAVRSDKGWVLNGQKTFISNGQLADFVIVVARTDPAARHRGISLLVVERGMAGFERGRNLDKIGMHAQDTSELFFNDVQVPDENLLGEEGGGFVALMQNLPRERTTIGVTALALAEKVFDDTLEYSKQRQAFGQPIGKFQHSKFVLAEMATELTVARTFTDRAIMAHCAGELSTEEASMAKWWNTDLCNRVCDRCVQLYGGYGYMREYPVARAWADSRAQSIFGGTNEIMKEIIGRSLGL
jgi:alkylation response protein AidB-like acyl-CoA dehydrogenase